MSNSFTLLGVESIPGDAMNELDLFVAAIAITDPAEQAAFLDRECAVNPALRQRLEALIAGSEQSRSPLDNPHLQATGGQTVSHGGQSAKCEHVPAEQAGDVIAGKYTLVEVIGEGGMGSVWRAKQTEPVKRFVAVKLIKAGMDSKQVLARFEAERQALALMDHPNIAKVLDGGLHEHRPFFVMELVKGVPITEYCDSRKLTPKQRLELFVPVCQAIQHAHQKGIIHRDIKPSNVLIALYDDKPVLEGDRLRRGQGDRRDADRADDRHRVRRRGRHAAVHVAGTGHVQQPGHRHAQRRVRPWACCSTNC